MWVLDSKGETTYEMEPMEPEGFFGYVIEKKSERLKKYRFRVEYGPDDVIEIDDPYAFPGMFGELDRYLFSEGNHYKIYEKLGAHPMKRDGVEGVQFAVWAPHACSVSVIGEFNMWDARLHKMIMRGSSGIFELFVPGAWEGAAYKYEITARSVDKRYKTDPYGNYAELRPGNASRITSLDGYKWQDGSYLMVCRGGGIWISKDGIAPYEQITDKRVYPPVKGEFEDSFIWRDSLQYLLIVNDWLGRIAFYQRSKDGIHWVTEQGEAYVPGISFHRDGHVEHWFKYERPKVFQDKQGRVEQMNFAVIDTVKWDDHGNDNHSSKNICIPMNKGMLLSVLNRTPITASTETIRVKVLAEEGFDPLREIDVPSLRFGSYNEVNFGRGCKVVKTEASGKDLILTFDGKGSGITPDEFAPKMIGKDKNGKLLFGYANLPYVDYKPALLSCRRPVYREGRNEVELEVQNFGLSASGEMTVEIKQAGAGMGRHTVKPLQPYEKASLTFTPEKGKWTDKADYQGVFLRDGQIVETNNFNISK